MKTKTHKTILIRMPNKKEYLVKRGNLPYLIDFAKTFDAKIFTVYTEAITALDLADLPKAICDVNYELTEKYTLVEKIIPFDGTPEIQHKVKAPPPALVATRDSVRKRAQEIKNRMRELLLAGDPVSLQTFHTEFETTETTKPTINNYFSRTRANLAEEGYIIIRIGPGQYQRQSATFNHGPGPEILLWN